MIQFRLMLMVFGNFVYFLAFAAVFVGSQGGGLGEMNWGKMLAATLRNSC